MVDDFIDRKHGRAAVAYPHPDLEPILKPTYGVILYQEQVMQIAQVLAGYSLGGADLLRRVMGKKKPEAMARQRAVFLEGAAARGVDERCASLIFDLMEKFAGYGFNKSHSAAYALVAYQTAWLKAHHPAAFMAAVLSADMDHTDKVVLIIDECRAMNLSVSPPDINRCRYAFSVEDKQTILYGLGAIKGVGAGAIEAIITEREHGPFGDLFELCRRIDTRRANRRVLEALIRAGALDRLGPGRASMMATLTVALQAAEQYVRDQRAGQDDMFGGSAPAAGEEVSFAAVPDWSDDERLSAEKETLGLYLTGHPISRYENELDHITSSRLVDLRPQPGRTHVVAGLVVQLRVIKSRKGRMAVVTLDDRSARVDVVVYSEEFLTARELLVRDRLLVVQGEVGDDEFTGGCSITAAKIYDFDEARERHARSLVIRVAASRLGNGMLTEFARTLEPYVPGATPVCIDYSLVRAAVELPLGERWRVHPTESLLRRLREIAGEGAVDVRY